MLLAGGPGAVAQPPNYYAVVTVTNKTSSTVSYEYRWGENAGWKRIELKPGAYHWHSWSYAYANQNHSPNFHIQFDSIRGSAFSRKGYRLDKRASPTADASSGRHHDFKDSADGRTVDLYKRVNLNN